MKNDKKKVDIATLFQKDLFKKSAVWLNFNAIPKSYSEKDGTFELEFIINDPRWVQKVINGENVFYDQIDNIVFPLKTFINSFNEANIVKYGGKGVPAKIREFQNHVLGATTVSGIEKLINYGSLEQAFLSCHSIFIHRLQVFVYLSEKVKIVQEDDWINFKKKNWKASELVKKCQLKFSTIDIDRIKNYNRSRNKVDHEMGKGTVDTRLLKDNLTEGLEVLNLIERSFLTYLSTLSINY